MKNIKRYPFSVRQHAHDIEYYHNYLFCTMKDMENGAIPMNSVRYNAIETMYFGKLQELMYALKDNGDGVVTYLTGEQLSLAKEIVIWADEQRRAKARR